MRIYYCILLIVIMLLGCKKDATKDNGDFAFLGGEIINPIDDFIIISKSKQNIDTIKLDGNNRFIFKLSNLEAGLFSFNLRSPFGLEYQVVLLEPKDSIMLRLNTLEFDESLVYTGKGAKKNNYLIEEFLKYEIEEKRIFKFCQLNPADYQKEIDSLKDNKLRKLEKFKSKYETSDLFNKIAHANIEYTYYFNKEIYPFVHYGGNKSKILQALPEDFYNYRKDVNYNDSSLKNYFNYHNFLRSSFNNMALTQHYKHTNTDHFKSIDVCYNLDRLALIDSVITNSEIKEELLHHYTISFLNRNRNLDNNYKIIDFYTNKSSNNDGKEMIVRYAKALNNLKIGTKFPEVKLIDTNNSETSVDAIINSPTVICFWSQKYYDHFKESQHKIRELNIKYPEVKFVIINIDDYDLDSTIKALKRNRFSLKNQYLFKNPKQSKDDLAIYPMTKAFIVDKNQKIVNSKANIFEKNFEEQLLGLINR
ncbi:peroxiredoxin family protein [Sabulilitoribacter arenilitoris]|uniref:Peroxiredoxin family protein n=1 Tax=Wocania arenilitoris TaxID=2044858 RepID=A0AAE3JLA2_9FLAO|nr:peroxiredoxin family protein [Wocania arenilitoris]MCF7568044.1 peroxiredoxin family protein [Wocania arenilitoris]